MSIGGIPSDHWAGTPGCQEVAAKAILSKEAVLQPMISFRVSGEEARPEMKMK